MNETTEDSLLRRVAELAAEQVGADPTTLTADTNFVADLNYDSLNVVELIMELEEEFELSIPDEQADSMPTIGHVVAMLRSLGVGGESRNHSAT